MQPELAEAVQRTSPESLAAPRVGWLLVLLSLVTYGYFYSPAAWNENSRFDLVRAIVEDHRFEIDRYHENTGDKATYRGHYYCDKAPGASFLAVPGYAVWYGARRLMGLSLPEQVVRPGAEPTTYVNRSFLDGLFLSTFLSVGVLSALSVRQVLQLALRWSGELRGATLASVGYGLGTLAFPYSTLLYGHQLAGALLVIGFGVCLAERDAPTRWGPVVTGLCAAYAVVSEFTSAVPALGLFVLGVWRAQRPRAFASGFVLGTVPPAILLGTYHTISFGAPWATAYSHVTAAEFAGMHQGLMGITHPTLEALWGILLGTHRGLLFVSPLALLGFFGLVRKVNREFRVEMGFAAAVALYFLLLNSSYYMWWGGSALGPRHAIPMLGFVCAPLALFRGRSRTVVLVVTAYSIVTMLVATVVGPEPPEKLDPVLAFHWGHFLANRVAVNQGSTNLGIRMHINGILSLLPLLFFWAWMASRLSGALVTGGPNQVRRSRVSDFHRPS